ncbi:hypothetical protein PM082_009538 [Marasmius tenuissimus]|nr:hypothetical protein PM082_009538 [Marasmius tenuissimus]
MFRTVLYLWLTIHSCVCFTILANPTITVGALATATWNKEVGDKNVGIRLIQCDTPQSPVIWGCLDTMEPSGTVKFTVPKIGNYQLKGFSESGAPGCNNVPGGNSDSRWGEYSDNGYPHENWDRHWKKDRHTERDNPDDGSGESDDESDDEDGNQDHCEDDHMLEPDRPVKNITAVASSIDPNRTTKIVGSVLGTLLFLLILAILIYLYRRHRRERRISHKEAGSSTCFEGDQMMVSNRPWHQSPAYSFPQTQARSEYTSSDSASTSDSKYSSSDASFSSITPSDSVSQIHYPSKTYNFQMKRKPLRTSTDLSTILESQGNRNFGSVDSSTMVSGSKVLDPPKPVFPNPIPVIITTNATPQSSVVG